MRPIVLTSLATATLLLGGCATHETLAELPTTAWAHAPSVLHATNPRMPDGVTVFAMAPLDTSAGRALQSFQTPNADYPSVGGNIMAGQSTGDRTPPNRN